MKLLGKELLCMLAKTYYEKAISNFIAAKTLVNILPNDEEQINIAAYHLQQSLELAIKHLFLINGEQIIKTHDIDQLIIDAKKKKIDLMLPDYIIEHAEIISNWESKTRYVMGYQLELNKVLKTIDELDSYFVKLAKTLTY